MKNTNFERVEHAHGDQRTERVVVHSKKKYGHWKLKILSLVLAFLIWLVIVNLTGASPKADEQSAYAGESYSTTETVI
jgi:hypothetical protein